ncbi:MAG TPA: polysaccharide deacetylase family protein [Anaerolineales bacterium]|nr:polysaccharide deacetylase family protein [Anaerolineales bacterium]
MQSLSRRDFLKLGGAGLLAAALPRQSRAAAAPRAAPIIYHGSDRWPRISLTYDDCQLVTRLHMLQGILLDNPTARVTLFPVGQALLNNESKDPGIWKWFHTRGHEFGYHGWDHSDPWVLSDAEMLADFDRWQEALHQVLGAQLSVQFARPPYGNLSNSFLSMCASRGKVATMWSTGFGGPVEVGVNAAKRARFGDIALLHGRNQAADPRINLEESWDMTISAQVLPYFEAQGIECVTLSSLYNDLLREQNNAPGCDVGKGQSLTRTCLD